MQKFLNASNEGAFSFFAGHLSEWGHYFLVT